jgi:hypothetical protein
MPVKKSSYCISIRRWIILLMILLTFTLAVLSATATATYVPESPIYLQMSPGVFSHPYSFGAKLGRMTVYHEGPIYNPTILASGLSGYTVNLKGPFKWWQGAAWDYNFIINMNVLAVAYPNGLGGNVRVTALSGRQHLLEKSKNEQVTVNPFIVDLYLVNTQSSGGIQTNPALEPTLNTTGGMFKIDSPYTFVSPFNPHFTFVGTNDLGTDIGNFTEGLPPDPQHGYIIEINSEDTFDTTPIVDQGGFTAGEGEGDGFWHGDEPPLPLAFFFEMDSGDVSFNIANAFGENARTYVNKAKMTVENGENNTTYAKKITFTDTNGTNAFMLNPVQGSGTGLEFRLFLGSSAQNNVEMNYGVAHTWTGLVDGLNEKNLYVGGIDADTATLRYSGEYRDTIIVNITNAD